jgi:hypothetical protein
LEQLEEWPQRAKKPLGGGLGYSAAAPGLGYCSMVSLSRLLSYALCHMYKHFAYRMFTMPPFLIKNFGPKRVWKMLLMAENGSIKKVFQVKTDCQSKMLA